MATSAEAINTAIALAATRYLYHVLRVLALVNRRRTYMEILEEAASTAAATAVITRLHRAPQALDLTNKRQHSAKILREAIGSVTAMWEAE